MRSSRGLVSILVLLLAAPFVVHGNDPLRAYAVNYPLMYFAKRIGGEHVEVVFPVPPDVDPAFWRPNAKTINAYQGADAILLNGAGYAKWTATAMLPRLKLVDTSSAFSDYYIQKSDVTHSHGPTGPHSHSGTAFTTWLDFTQAAVQARAVEEALTRKRPHLRETFATNHLKLESELLALHDRIKSLASRRPHQPLLASHPVYQYLARRYGLNLVSVHWEPDEVPGEASWQMLEAVLSTHPAKWMLWEGMPRADSVARLEGLGVRSIVFSPCANRPEQGDFMDVMGRNVADLEQAFR